MHIPFLLSLSTILLGYLLKRTGFLKQENSTVLSKIVMNVTFPAQILVTMTTSELSFDLFMLPVIPLFAAVIGLCAGFILFRELPAERKGLMLMSTMGLNIGLFAFPILHGLYGDEGLKVAALIDMGNAFVIFGISYMVGERYSPQTGDHRRSLLETVRVFGRSVPLYGYLLAVILNLSSVSLPDGIYSWLSSIGRANQFLVLLVLGLVLRFDWRHHLGSGLVSLIILRYVLGLSLGVLFWFFAPLDEMVRKITLLCLILPAGFAVVPYSIEFGYDRLSAGAVVNMTLIISFFLMWGLAVFL